MPEITKAQSQIANRKSQISWFLFAFVIIAVYFFALSIPLLGPDETRYSQVAREMFERNDWITPTLGGFDWFEKPALLYWLQIASYKLFGVSEFAARFGSALFGLGTIVSLWILGRFSATENTENHREFEDKNDFSSSFVNSVAKKDFANYLALIAASSIGLLAFSRGASFDIILTFPITAALVSFFLFDRSAKKSGFNFYFLLFTFYFFIGISLIAKGLVGIVFPFAIAAFYHVLSWKLPSKKFIFSLIWGTILALIVASAWYLPMYQANGWKFIDEFFIQHHFQRYTSNKYQHPQPFWFFFAILPLMTIPWLPFFLASIWNLFKDFFQRKNPPFSFSRFLPFSFSPLLLFSFAWLAVPLVFFSLSGSKLPGYILPVLPAALILTAFEVYKFAQKSAKREIFIKIVAFATFVVVAIILQFFIMDYARHETTKYLIETANAQGFKEQKIVNLYAVQHSLEFYAARRLVRETDGKLKRYDDFSVLINDMKRENTSEMLVVVSNHAAKNLTESGLVEAKIIDDNGEISLIFIKIKNF
ncbi:MAG TPA: glycosyltransferase family 39 protein [Pyrinomonadaceae bacterium]|nr:glycosyltransferase family 39 protein [Pyrinomonadaceae bacterium]